MNPATGIWGERNMKNKNIDTIIDIPTYRKHWVYDKPYGHDIVIASDSGKYTIQCKWPDLERSGNGRVSKIDRARGTSPAVLRSSEPKQRPERVATTLGVKEESIGRDVFLDDKDYVKKLSKFYKGE
jgi:hypothetical protein